MDPKTAGLIKTASETLRAQEAQIADLTEKLASTTTTLEAFQRAEMAQEIVILKVASGAAQFDDVQDFISEVERLSESDRDLGQLKMAMQYAGPQFVQHGLVTESDEMVTEKEAAVVSADEPAHLAAARRELDALMASSSDN